MPDDAPVAALERLRRFWDRSPSPQPTIPWPSALWRGAMVSALLVVGVLLDRSRIGVTVAIGALITFVVPVPRHRGALGHLVAGRVLFTPTLGFLAALAGDTWWLVVVLPAIGLVCGALSAHGAAGFNVAVPTMAVTIGLSGTVHRPADALGAAVAIAAGALVAGAAMWFAWPVERAHRSGDGAAGAAAAAVGSVPVATEPLALLGMLRDALGVPERRVQGVRMAVGLGAATVVSLGVDLQFGYWVAMAVAMVLKADQSATVDSARDRVAGTVAAAVAVALLFAVVGRERLGYALAVALSAPVTIRYLSGNRLLGTFGMSGTILLLVESLHPNDAAPAARVIDTLIGAAIALAVVVAIPAPPAARD